MKLFFLFYLLSFNFHYDYHTKVYEDDVILVKINYEKGLLRTVVERDGLKSDVFFTKPLTQEEYLDLHHNTGQMIHITYYQFQGKLFILEWEREKRNMNPFPFSYTNIG